MHLILNDSYINTRTNLILYNIFMRSLFKLCNTSLFSTKKLGIADTAKVIQDKILGITQSVNLIWLRMILKSLEQSSPLETVLLECLALLKSKQDRWSNSGQELEEWPWIWRLIMLEWSSSVTIERFNKEILSQELELSSMFQLERKCWVESSML